MTWLTYTSLINLSNVMKAWKDPCIGLDRCSKWEDIFNKLQKWAELPSLLIWTQIDYVEILHLYLRPALTKAGTMYH